MPDPVPRSRPWIYAPVAWPVEGIVPLESGATRWMIDLASTLTRRRSVRSCGPLTLSALGALLWQTSRTLAVAMSPYGFEIQQRPTPSAGAIHPIHLVLQEPNTGRWARYDSHAHRLELLGFAGSVLDNLHARAAELVEFDAGTVLAFVAEPGLTAAKYEHADSLIWRDAGVLQGSLAIVAEALLIDMCLLGATGDPWVGELAEQGKLKGVGLAVLGSRS